MWFANTSHPVLGTSNPLPSGTKSDPGTVCGVDYCSGLRAILASDVFQRVGRVRTPAGNAKATYAPDMGACSAGWPATSCVYVVACAAAQNTTYSRPST